MGGSMSGRQDSKELVRERLDIADIIGETVVLKPAGNGRLKGLCPFHPEKTPSFHVHRERGFYYCFGCHAKGDVFDFVMQTQGLPFGDVLRRLAARAGVEIEPPAPGQGRRTDLYRVNALAQEYFRENLAGPAAEYLAGRGMSQLTIDTWGLGYAPDGWDGLLKYAAARGTDAGLLAEAGLLSSNEAGRTYDRFRGRVMFPIRDALGRLAGFSGRILGEGEPKYLNTPETSVFHKGELLYGLDQARTAIRESGECVVVEGYMDVIALHQAGISNVVAALGTALTTDQADLLARQDVRQLRLAFDGDAAGQRAVLAGLDRTIGRQFLVSAVPLPPGQDPADVVAEGGPEAFRKLIARSTTEVSFRLRATMEKHDARTDQGRQAIINELLPSLRPRGIIDPVASELKRLVVSELDINESALQQLIDSSRAGRVDAVQARGLGRSADMREQLEYEILGLLLQDPSALRARCSRLAGSVPDMPGSVLLEFVEVAGRLDHDLSRLLDHYRERPAAAIIFQRLFQVDDGDGPRKDIDLQLDRALSRLREMALNAERQTRSSAIMSRIREVEELLSDPDLPRERLEVHYAELFELGELLLARDAERRLRTPRR